LAVLSSQPVRATRNSLVFRGAAMRARSRKEILSRAGKEFLGATLRLEKFDGATVRSFDSSTMKYSSQCYNQNESAGMSHMLRALGKSLSCFVLLQVDAKRPCNAELNCAGQLIAGSIATAKSGVAYARSQSNYSSAGSSPRLQQEAIIHDFYSPLPLHAGSCAGLRTARSKIRERFKRYV
jgi:hypothetical protein